MDINPDQVILGILVGLPSFFLGYLGLRRAMRVDAVSAQAGMATESRAGIGQMYEHLNQFIETLQADNQSFREEVKYLTQRIDQRDAECDELRKKLNAMYRRYGENNS